MSSQAFHTTDLDLRKQETRSSLQHKGKTPKDADVSILKSMVNENTDKTNQVDRTKANLPLPEQPPVASDWQSADQRTVNVGSGGLEGPMSGEHNSALREPATASSSARLSGEEWHQNTEPLSNVGRQGKDNLDGLPKDARTR